MDELVAEFSLSQMQKDKEIDVYKIFCNFLLAINQGKGGLFVKYVKLALCTSNDSTL